MVRSQGGWWSPEGTSYEHEAGVEAQLSIPRWDVSDEEYQKRLDEKSRMERKSEDARKTLRKSQYRQPSDSSKWSFNL